MIRVVSTFCVGLVGAVLLANYQISEQARVASRDLTRAHDQVENERVQISMLEAQWQKQANPATVQKLAVSTLGMQSAPTVQLASVRELPRRGDAPLNGEAIRSANAEGATRTGPVIAAAMHSGM